MENNEYARPGALSDEKLEIVKLTARHDKADVERSQSEIQQDLHRQPPPPSRRQRDQSPLVVCPLLPQGQQQLKDRMKTES